MYAKPNRLTVFALTILFIVAVPKTGICLSDAIMDIYGQPVIFNQPPRRAISLVPSITEIIVALGAQKALKGITYHDADMGFNNHIAIVGGYSAPSLDAIAALNPDIIFLSDMHLAVEERFADSGIPVLFLETGSTIAKSIGTIHQLGLIFGEVEQAAGIIKNIRADLDLIAGKTAGIPEKEKQRVIRLMGGSKVMTPGINSFQNEMIRAAGGITHTIYHHGAVIPVSVDQWQAFDPEMIYGCHGDDLTAAAFFSLPEWKGVSAVKNGRIFYFPCDLTCRAATHTGDFVAWLAASIYTQHFSDTNSLVLKENILETRGLPGTVDLPDYIKKGRIVHSRIYDFINKTLILDFSSPMTILSSLDGWRDNIQTIGNHNFPPPCWPVSHHLGMSAFRDHVLDVLSLDKKASTLLFTGADMDHLSIQAATFKDLTVWACVTAGVSSNALRMSADEGRYYEPGTINIILFANMPLARRAMTRAIITATEAKTAALLDLDIRSSYNHGSYRATGTGTDNIIVIQGKGKLPPLDNAGGHSRLGQLMAEAVYNGVKDAVEKQNGLTEERDVFQRLAERDISIYGLIDPAACKCSRPVNVIAADLETLLLDPVFAGFVELAFAVNDDYEKGLLTDLTAFNCLALDFCSQVAEKEIKQINNHVKRDNLPVVIKTAFNALLKGINMKDHDHSE